MRMVKDSKNCRVLKLVHPGGFVEIHQNPITADEIMKKNPRHCVTRPDVFKFPWIVVRPESVLKPGAVFYIVPFHTIHILLKKNRHQYQDPLLLHLQHDLVDSVEVTYFHHLMEKQSLNILRTRIKVDCKIEDWPDDSIFPNCLLRNKKVLDASHSQESLVKSHFELEHFDDSLNTAFDYKNHQEPKQLDGVDSSVKSRSSFSSDDASNTSRIEGAVPKVDCVMEPNSCREKALKSCLRKSNQPRSLGLRVKFSLPDEET
ncbi:hypothetical protein JCGZ_23143 [Jatropha curcas]|uniref:Uncharacterized protein n=1 Tax=Jatropha curcas TaxID=180498 RepID=A0A067JTJ1_JATCU|nr:hypothetical protein JCGZ_23143 [Jatropha curcas]